ncbi:MAG: fructosamine kinase family protein [Saprospirales bacterium]|nr:fructosamine kinase family protein [Saprospirales bacterium]
MNLPFGLDRQCAAIVGPVFEVHFLGGGDISTSRLLKSERGSFFLKYQDGPEADRLLETEAQGLDLLRDHSPIRIPDVLSQGSSDGYAYLLLEYYEPGWANEAFWESFGAGLAQLHRNSAPQFGLHFDNFIGNLPQSNGFMDNWTDFYRDRRLAPQARLAHSKGLLHSSDLDQLERLYNRLPELMPVEAPALIHGDLWSGNYLVSKAQDPVLIDPSVSFAHREMDLAMSRLFSGFDWRFYRSYEAAFPLSPGFEARLPIYQLYYLLVHLNLFGESYLGSVREILGRYGEKS